MAMKRLFKWSSTVASTYVAVATIFSPKTSAASVKHPTPAVAARSYTTISQRDNIFMECSTHSQEGEGLDSTSKGGQVEMWVDMPGMEKEWIEVETDYKRDIQFVAKAPKEWENEEIGRIYLGVFDLGCRCCHIKDFKHTVDNGVLRIVASTTKLNIKS